MTLGDLIKQYTTEHAMTQEEFGAKCGLSKGYVSMLINNLNPRTGRPPVPRADTYFNIARALGMTMDELFRSIDDAPIRVNASKIIPIEDATGGVTVAHDEPKHSGTITVLDPQTQFTAAEKDVIFKYRALDDFGRKTVHAVMDVEAQRVAQEIEQGKKPTIAPIRTIHMRRFSTAAAAGSPVWADSDSEFVDYPEDIVPPGTDYAVGISGHSMEPEYPDGCTVFVRSTSAVADGDIVLAWLDGEGMLCKRAKISMGHLLRLESINRDYEDYRGSALYNAKIYGKVLGYAI